MNGLDLFSGIGGIAEALCPWVKTIAYCEREPKSIAILLSRMGRGEIDAAPIWDDVSTLSGKHFDCSIDIISGGFPCTDISLAGLRKGLDSDRSGLFWEIVRLTKEIRPKIIFLENVWPGVKKFVPTIRTQFEAMGYDVRDGYLAASDVGAPHKRQRWFCVAYSNKTKLWKQSRRSSGKTRESTQQPKHSMESGQTSNSYKVGCEGFRNNDFCTNQQKKQSEITSLLERNNWNENAKFFCGMDNGLPLRNYAIGALGDSVVPQQARVAFEILTGLKTAPISPTKGAL